MIKSHVTHEAHHINTVLIAPTRASPMDDDHKGVVGAAHPTRARDARGCPASPAAVSRQNSAATFLRTPAPLQYQYVRCISSPRTASIMRDAGCTIRPSESFPRRPPTPRCVLFSLPSFFTSRARGIPSQSCQATPPHQLRSPSVVHRQPATERRYELEPIRVQNFH